MEMSSEEDDDQIVSYLPLEVLSQIFEYLPFVDRQNASLVCHHWFTASLDQRLTSRLCISFDHISYLTNKVDILRLFTRSVRPYTSIVIQDCEITASPEWLDLFEKLSPHIRYLTVNRCDVSEKMFVQMIQSLRNLRRLVLHCTNQLLMSGRLFEDQTDLSQLKLKHCEQLELVYNRYLSDRIIYRFFALCPRLQHVSLCNTNISFHRGLYKRFYPAHLLQSANMAQPESNPDNGHLPECNGNSSNNNKTTSNFNQSRTKNNQNQSDTNQIRPKATRQPFLSETVLTFVNILDLMSVHAATLQSLDLSQTLVDNESLAQLATLEKLELRRLVLTNCDQVSNEGFMQLFQHQTHLVHVDLSSCSRLTDRSVLSLSQHCTGLRELHLRNCAGLTDRACQELSSRLPRLELLDISHCIGITGQGLSQMFQSSTSDPKAPRLRSLVLSGLNIVPREFQPILTHCSQLRILDLSHCFNMVSDETLRALFEHCRRLTELSLAMCEGVTDWGLVGLRSQDFDTTDTGSPDTGSPDTVVGSSEFSPTSPQHSLKLSLGCKAEQEIRSDAKRKTDALLRLRNSVAKSDTLNHACARSKTPMYGLNQVTGLTKLNLYGCSKITDVSLIYALNHLPHLQVLDLGDIQQVSSEGIEALSKNNFRINTLKLNRCFNLRDLDIETIASSMRTLQSLDISNCVCLTDASLLSLARHCGSLRSLYLQKCAAISPSAVNLLAASLSSLHTILYSSPTSVDLPADVPKAPPLSRTGAIRRN